MAASMGRSRQSCWRKFLAITTPSSEASSDASPVAVRPNIEAMMAVSRTFSSSTSCNASRRASNATSCTILTGPLRPRIPPSTPIGAARASTMTTCAAFAHANCTVHGLARYVNMPLASTSTQRRRATARAGGDRGETLGVRDDGGRERLRRGSHRPPRSLHGCRVRAATGARAPDGPAIDGQEP